MQSLFVVSSEFPPGPGGIGQHAFHFSFFLSSERPVFVLTNGDYTTREHLQEFDSKQPFKVLRFRRYGPFTQIYRFVVFIEQLLKQRPSSVFFTGLFSIWMMPLCRLFFPSTQRFAILHGHEPIFGNFIVRLITRFSFSFADKIVAVSQFAACNLILDWQKDKRISIIPNGIDPDELSGWISKSDFLNRKYTSVDTNGFFPTLLTVGHTSPRKGHHNVIAALPLIKLRFPSVRFYCVGRDVRNEFLKNQANKLGVLNSVVFEPPCTNRYDLGKWYLQADIFMLLSENQPNGDVEGFGIVALEANYFGVPVIGAKGCGVEDAVQDGISGILVDPTNPYEIAQAVSTILADWQGFSSRSRIHALEFDWNKVKVQYMNLLN